MGTRRNPQGPLSTSRLVQIGVVNGVVFWDRTDPPEILPLTTDSPHIIKIDERHDLLATRRLRSPQLGWVIMERNKDIDPEEIDMRLWPNDFVPGRTILIPTRRSLSDRSIV